MNLKQVRISESLRNQVSEDQKEERELSMQPTQTREGGQARVQVGAVPAGLGPSAGGHDEDRPGVAGAAARPTGALVKAGGPGQRADVTQVT